MTLWTWDANHFDFSDDSLHTFDGWHADVWYWDADHFTFDDNLNHTFDGWHDDTGIVVVPDDDGGGATIPYPEILTPERRKRNSLIMLFAREYMKRIH